MKPLSFPAELGLAVLVAIVGDCSARAPGGDEGKNF